MILSKSISGGCICSVIISVFLALTVSSCALKGKSLSQEDMLRQRICAFWDLVVEGRYDQAYEYEYPILRKDMDVNIYSANWSNPLARYRGAQIKSIEFKEDGLASVKMVFDIALKPPGLKGSSCFKFERPEKWVESDGQWYHVPSVKGIQKP